MGRAPAWRTSTERGTAVSAWSQRSPFETHENWMESNRCLNMDDLREHKKLSLRQSRLISQPDRHVADILMYGRFRMLAIVDDFTRECLGLVVDTSLTGLRVNRELDRIAEARAYPAIMVSDNGTELT